ncbi:MULTISPECIES: hypothetical protein [Arthrospira]|jgi:polyhydroxyalkanoate synthesis regulator phasin|uniref:Uncharacterized protein n=3 Tax=Limnospira platensis TaxID=118562 RepID=A0A5M3T5B1_LIMPL|nr:hypothetical protein [Arthrospira platensis]AMW27044.1 hypothetical protein AP285_02630 [Arthrospira platensis YZ]KDR57055.1 hypothetical protein APPUASWS_013055 [Arthrospira platensis str. Paraca]MBD2670810.1 hypothetical protein [Arthrospira platensis FACHB-439]MBD2711536.1 hypothetical protein [Arthrospira platensis FACHB-835]MDF2211502.1 hypothetical protein [Arthrospira platensis NCB002]MDT9181911.1 hypothetical protein [Limnospira sp. PMC 289.06]MDT9296278.1 hypothetical protein [Ar
MNVDNLTQMLHQGFRVTLGATSSLIEILQDPQKREANLETIQSQLNELAQEWAEKGAITEEEARSFVDTLLSQSQSTQSSEVDSSNITTPTDSTESEVSSPQTNEITEIQNLTSQIAKLREELERLRESDAS